MSVVVTPDPTSLLTPEPVDDAATGSYWGLIVLVLLLSLVLGLVTK